MQCDLPWRGRHPSLHERLHVTGDYEKARTAFITRQPIGRLGEANKYWNAELRDHRNAGEVINAPVRAGFIEHNREGRGGVIRVLIGPGRNDLFNAVAVAIVMILTVDSTARGSDQTIQGVVGSRLRRLRRGDTSPRPGCCAVTLDWPRFPSPAGSLSTRRG